MDRLTKILKEIGNNEKEVIKKARVDYRKARKKAIKNYHDDNQAKIAEELKAYKNDPALLRKKRDELILKLANKDYPYRSIGKYFGISYGRVWQIFRKQEMKRDKNLT